MIIGPRLEIIQMIYHSIDLDELNLKIKKKFQRACTLGQVMAIKKKFPIKVKGPLYGSIIFEIFIRTYYSSIDAS